MEGAARRSRSRARRVAVPSAGRGVGREPRHPVL